MRGVNWGRLVRLNFFRIVGFGSAYKIAADRFVGSQFFILLLAVYWVGVANLVFAPNAKAELVWKDISGQVTLTTSNPLRNRRSPDAKVNIEIVNSSAEPLVAPLRLVLGTFTPNTVSLQNASGTTASGDPYIDLAPYVGESMAAGASTGIITLTILGGGPTNFSFFPRVEQQLDTTPPPLSVQITQPQTLITVGSTPLQVLGTINDPNATLTVNGAPINHSGGTFSAAVSLEEGHNTIVARAVNSAGQEVTDSISVSMDLTPPYITVESPEQGQTVSTATIAVSGLVNDIVRGTISENQANVRVNGIPATVANRSYLAENVPLTEGDNDIVISASDQVGNTSTLTITVRYIIPAAKHIELSAGQNQSAQIRGTLNNALAVKLIDSDGVTPVPNKPVVFRVIQGDGVLAPGTDSESQAVLATSDANGIAQTAYKLGSRSGNGNQRVRARAVGFDGEVVFYASATPKPGDKVSINSGNNQRGAISQPLPQPFVVAVTDEGANVIQGTEVEFKVNKGGGQFQNGLDTYTATSDSDGRATAHLTLGPDVGLDVHRVTATIVGTTISAGFTASGLQAGDPGNTRITGVVLDNQDTPLPGVTIRVDGTTRQAIADEQGRFTITEVPVGPVHLIVDGGTTSVSGEWPTLSYNLVTVAGAVNPLSAPIYLVKLNTTNAAFVGGNQEVTLTLPEVPGFALTIKPNSVTFPDGSDQGLISVTPVNASKVPMPPPNGMQPQFIVTIQPAGAKFDPPAPLSLPNVDGHAPGAQVEMYSYDHDLEEFVSIGLGTVSADGSVIHSNPGIGVVKAGWHCGSQPSGQGCTHNCPVCQDCDSSCNCQPANNDPRLSECKKCSGGAEVADPAKDDSCCTNGICQGGTCKTVELTDVTAKVEGVDEFITQFVTGGVTVNFTGVPTGNNCEYEYKWTFGDGATSIEQNPSHNFVNPNEYDVSLEVKCKKCGPSAPVTDAVKVIIPMVELVTPKGDPVAAPSNSGDGQNEFTFNNAAPGVLTVNFKAKVTPNTIDLNKVKEKVVFSIENVGTPPVWNAANPGGKASVSGTNLVAEVKFNGLPASNGDFGSKKTELKFDGTVVETVKIEVFFSRDAANHPGGQMGSPNWFHYWLEGIGGRANTDYVASLGGNYGETPGMLNWSYTTVQDKTKIKISDVARTNDSGDACASGGKKATTGIDTFEDTVLHENHHTVQVASADTAVGIVPNSPWRFGWAWNQGANHNHWSLGPDTQPGVAGVDDDGDGTVDNLVLTGPGELGNGDDVVLHDTTVPAQQWPNVFGALPPLCWATGFAVEDAAYDKEPDNEDARLAVDWGDPGKQHLTKSASD